MLERLDYCTSKLSCRVTLQILKDMRRLHLVAFCLVESFLCLFGVHVRIFLRKCGCGRRLSVLQRTSDEQLRFFWPEQLHFISWRVIIGVQKKCILVLRLHWDHRLLLFLIFQLLLVA